MIVAILDGQLARGQRGKRAKCPGCGGEVYGREPLYVIPHWAHMPTPGDPAVTCEWDRAMTEWHRVWQSRRTDVTCIEVYRKPHFADVINSGGMVIEFQHSAIAVDVLQERESFWGAGIWVLDGTGMNESDSTPRVVVTGRPLANDDQWVKFHWRRSPLILTLAAWPCWIDLGNGRGLIQVLSTKGREGVGWLVSTEWFVDNVVNGTAIAFRNFDPTPTTAPARVPVTPEPVPARALPFNDGFCWVCPNELPAGRESPALCDQCRAAYAPEYVDQEEKS